MDKNSLLARRAAKKKNLAATLFSGALQKRNLNQNDNMNKSIVITDNQSVQAGKRPPPLNLKSQESQRRKESKKTKDTFEQKYDVFEELGQGAHAVVKRCVKKSNQKQYAVKIIRSSDEEIVIASVNCFKLQKILNSCSLLCRNYELFIDEEKENIYQVMDYIQWPSLSKFQHQFHNKQIPENIVKIVIKQICQAVEFMHDKGICHRDLKPDNILVDIENNYKIKIIDFGIARKFLSKDPSNKYNILRHDMWSRTGTLCYKAPEMFSSANYNESCDIWSVGIITYEILSGKLPFYEEYQTDTIEKIEECDYSFNDIGDFKWKQHSQARDFIKRILKPIDKKRLTAKLSLSHPFLQNDEKKAKKIKDDGGIGNSTYKINFEMAKSTAADQLQMMRMQHKKNRVLEKSDSRGNAKGQKQQNQQQVQNTSEVSDKSNPSYLKYSVYQNNSNDVNPMTQSQIQMFREDDIHINKQKINFGGFMFNSKKEKDGDIFQSQQSQKNDDQNSVNNSQKFDQEFNIEYIQDIKMQKCESIQRDSLEEKPQHKLSFNLMETRGPSVSISLNKPPQDLASNSSSNASPQLRPPPMLNNLTGRQDAIYNNMNSCSDQVIQDNINLNENDNNNNDNNNNNNTLQIKANIINKYNSNENIVYSENGDDSRNSTLNQIQSLTNSRSNDQQIQLSNSAEKKGQEDTQIVINKVNSLEKSGDSDGENDQQYKDNFNSILENELSMQKQNSLQIVNQQKIRDSYQNNVAVIAEEDIQDEQTEFTASPRNPNDQQFDSITQKSQSQLSSSNLSQQSPMKGLQLNRSKKVQSVTSFEEEGKSLEKKNYKKQNSQSFQVNQVSCNNNNNQDESYCRNNILEDEFQDLQEMPEIQNK